MSTPTPILNPDLLDKPQLVDHLVRITGQPAEYFAQDSVRTLRTALAASLQSLPSVELKASSPAVTGPVQLTDEDIDKIVHRLAPRVEQRVLTRVRAVARPAPDGDEGDEGGKAVLTLVDPVTPDSALIEVDPTYRNPFPGFSDRLARRSADGEIVNVALYGPSGTGKTTYALQFAAAHARPCHVIDVGAYAEAEQLLGTWTADSGTVTFRPAELLKFVQTEGAVIIFDELTRAANSKVTNILFSLLDDRRYVDVPTVGRVRVAPGVVFFATLNEGVEFTGADIIDGALNTRFPQALPIPYSNHEVDILVDRTGIERNTAIQLVAIASSLRGSYENLSLRALHAVAKEVIYGAPLGEALLLTLGRIVDTDVLIQASVAVVPGITFPNR